MSDQDQKDKKPQFEWVEHSNGTYSIRDLENLQAMHSRIGPWEEANRVYAEPSRPEEFLKKNKTLVIHDVGMGTAANAIAAIERCKAANLAERVKLEIHSFELKPDGLRFALGAADLGVPRLPFLSLEYRGILELLLDQGEVKVPIGPIELHWFLHLGDYSKTLSKAPAADLIYYDFYSPKVVPEFWTEGAFKHVVAHQGAHPFRLFTYSSATPTRLNLLLAGYFIGEGRSTGVKTETTVAASDLGLLENPLTDKWLTKLDTSASISERTDKDRVRSHPQFRKV